jgi:hypothetical protein
VVVVVVVVAVVAAVVVLVVVVVMVVQIDRIRDALHVQHQDSRQLPPAALLLLRQWTESGCPSIAAAWHRTKTYSVPEGAAGRAYKSIILRIG